MVAGDATRYAWTLKGPEATLYDKGGKKIGRHFAGPTWEGNDGSTVVGEVVSRADSPTGDSIPWLLLSAKSDSGRGLFASVKFIQRLHTVGGNAPTADCSGCPLRCGAPREVFGSGIIFSISRPGLKFDAMRDELMEEMQSKIAFLERASMELSDVVYFASTWKSAGAAVPILQTADRALGDQRDRRGAPHPGTRAAAALLMDLMHCLREAARTRPRHLFLRTAIGRDSDLRPAAGPQRTLRRRPRATGRAAGRSGRRPSGKIRGGHTLVSGVLVVGRGVCAHQYRQHGARGGVFPARCAAESGRGGSQPACRAASLRARGGSRALGNPE